MLKGFPVCKMKIGEVNPEGYQLGEFSGNLGKLCLWRYQISVRERRSAGYFEFNVPKREKYTIRCAL